MSIYTTLRNSLYLRYGIGLLTIFSINSMIQAINQNHAMEQNIANMDVKIEKTRRENIFLEKIYKPYLNSELAYRIISHEQGRLFAGEKIVRLTEGKTIEPTIIPVVNQVKPLSSLYPHQARKEFFQQIYSKNFTEK